MKKYIILFLLTCFTSLSFSQIHEVGFFAGGANYIGDIGKENYLIPNKGGFGFIYKYNLNPRMALRATFTYLDIYGDDLKSDNSFRKNRGINVSNSIHEFATGIEFNFFDYNINDPKTSFTPYILAQLAIFNYKSLSNNFSEITSDVDFNDNIAFDNKASFTMPVGIGIKGRLSQNLAYGLETAVRFTFIDDLDYTTSKIPSLDFEGNGNDHYIFTSFSLVYSFGRPPCYAPRD